MVWFAFDSHIQPGTLESVTFPYFYGALLLVSLSLQVTALLKVLDLVDTVESVGFKEAWSKF